MKVTVYICNSQKKVALTDAVKRLSARAVRSALKSEGFPRSAEVSITFTDDEGIRKMNSEYRGKDCPTDVLSFPLFDDDYGDGMPAALGDIVISLERALLQAQEYGHSLEREVAFLCVHSVLHLLGYDHETGEKEEKEMFEKQESILEKMGLPRK